MEKYIDLKETKTKTKKKYFIGTLIILIITVVSFILAPIFSGGISAGGAPLFGKYGSEEIKISDSNYFGVALRYSRNASERDTFERAVLIEAIKQQFKKEGFAFTDAYINRQILEMFTDSSGVFDENGYLRLSPSEKRQLRILANGNSLFNMFSTEFINSVAWSDSLLDSIIDVGNVEKLFNYTIITYDDYPDSEVNNFFDENSTLFESRTFSRITVNSEEEAIEVKRRIEGGEEFSLMANEFSTDSYSESGGEWGEHYRYELSGSFSRDNLETLFNSDSDELLVMESRNQWVVVKPTSEPQPLERESEEALETVRTYISDYESGTLESWLEERGKELRRSAIQAENFSKEARDSGFSAKSSGYITVEHSDLFFLRSTEDSPFIKEFQTGASSALDFSFYQKAFSLKEGEISEPILVYQQTSPVFVIVELVDTRLKEEEKSDEQEGTIRFSEKDALLFSLKTGVLPDDFKQSVLTSDKFKDSYYEARSKLVSPQ